MLEFILYYLLLYISKPTKQKIYKNINKLEIQHFMQCQWTFLNMNIFAALSICSVVTSDKTHTGIRACLQGQCLCQNEYQNELLCHIPIHFQSYYSTDCSRHAMVHFRINTLQTDSMYLMQEINVVYKL